MPLIIVRNDITKMSVDAVVNAANPALKQGGGVCGAIFQAAGAKELQDECDKLGGCGIGEAVVTSGGRLPARFIIHTPGPVWQDGGAGEEILLRSCYRSSLTLALQNGCESIAFPLISSGIYGYPKDKALRVAATAIEDFLREHDMRVYLVVYDRQSFQISSSLFSDIERYIDDHYEDEHRTGAQYRRLANRARPRVYEHFEEQVMAAPSAIRSLEDVLEQLDTTFSEMLLRLIDQKGMTEVEAYKRANIDRKLFSKIRSNKHYNPSKATTVAFAIALRLNLDEARDLLGKAGYALSCSSKFDVIIEYCINQEIYSVLEVNEALFAFGQPLLGA